MSGPVVRATLTVMEHVPPPAEELALLDRELVRLDARRSELLTRRAWLLSVLQPPATPPGSSSGPVSGAPASPWQPYPHRPAGPFGTPGAQASRRGAQNVLLSLGGLLLTIAAIAFTLLSWGRMGIGGRCAVLTVVTVAALATPAMLLRRGLRSTAESLGALALVLTVLDAYALHAVAAPETDGPGFAAVASAVLAGLWAAYGLALGKLRLPLPAAVVAAQFTGVLWAWAAGASASGFGWALLLTAAADCAIAVWGTRAGARVTACVGGCVTGLAGTLVALVQSLTAGSPLSAVAPGALLLAAAAVALLAAWRAPKAVAVVGGAAAGLAVVAGVGGVPAAGVAVQWAVPVYLLCGLLLSAAVRAPLPRPAGQGVLGASAAVVAGAVLTAVPAAGAVVVGPVSRTAAVWSGAPDGGVRGAMALRGMAGAQLYPAPVVLLVVAALLAAAYRWWPRWVRVAGSVVAPGGSGRGTAGAAAVVLGWAGLLVLPVALDAAYAAVQAVELMLVAAVLAVAVRGLRHGPGQVVAAALACGSVGAASAGLLSLAAEPATYAVFGTLLVTFAAAAVATHAEGTPAARVVQGVTACAAVVCAAVLAGAVGASLEPAAHRAAAPIMLVVPVLTALLGARLRGGPPALPVELTGAAAGAVAVGMAVPDRPMLATVLALCGVLAAGTAVRAERRQVAGRVAVVLFVLATWVRLSASGVSAPEAYTLPATVPALVVGLMRRRRDPAASSWTAYGPGLAATLVPSLFAVWADPTWVRPLLLGTAALVITLAGARMRLQALLLLGGAVLALDALHELAPYVVQVVGALPRWLPPALAGVVLLVVGATYEKRLRDARRLKDALGRMR
ncbi:SCO7613 C-terminal domain-containing membrane protein [Streptomyces sp. LN785]|uniref:SCO7613 C-terminal domain-containing membrane protein n=1 Tax=Streptomyces sp. LN785 TaxID=3112983 RepID=UPI003724B7E4